MEAGQEGGAVGLVETVGEGIFEGGVIFGEEGGGDEGGALNVGNRFGAFDLAGKDAACVFGFHGCGGNGGDAVEVGIDVGSEPSIWQASAEATEGGGCDVVGMTFEFDGQSGDVFGRKGLVEAFVESEKDAEPDDDAAAKTARGGDFSLDFNGKGLAMDSGCGEKTIADGEEEGVVWKGFAVGDGDSVAHGEGEAEAIEAGAKVCGGGGDVVGDRLHEGPARCIAEAGG